MVFLTLTDHHFSVTVIKVLFYFIDFWKSVTWYTSLGFLQFLLKLILNNLRLLLVWLLFFRVFLPIIGQYLVIICDLRKMTCESRLQLSRFIFITKNRLLSNGILNLKEVTLLIHLSFNALLISNYVLISLFVFLRIFILAYLIIMIIKNISHRSCWRKDELSRTRIYLACLWIVRVSCQKRCVIFYAFGSKLFQIFGRDPIKMTWLILFNLITTLTNIRWLFLLFVWALLIFR